MSTPVKDYCRTIDETYSVQRTAVLTEAQLLAAGYASIAAAAAALDAATVQMVVPLASPAVTVDATVSAVQVGSTVELSIAIAPPTSLTDAVQAHDYYVVLEPGSATSERRLWRGLWTVLAAPESV